MYTVATSKRNYRQLINAVWCWQFGVWMPNVSKVHGCEVTQLCKHLWDTHRIKWGLRRRKVGPLGLLLNCVASLRGWKWKTILFNLAHLVYIVKCVCVHCFAAVIGILHDLLLQWISELKIAAQSVDHILLKYGELYTVRASRLAAAVFWGSRHQTVNRVLLIKSTSRRAYGSRRALSFETHGLLESSRVRRRPMARWCLIATTAQWDIPVSTIDVKNVFLRFLFLFHVFKRFFISKRFYF